MSKLKALKKKKKKASNLRTIKKKREQFEIEKFFLITIWEERAIALIIKNLYI